MAREHVSMDELHRSLREHGINSGDQVALAVLEVRWLNQLLEVWRD
jgi:uncharacterized membrane protein YcaP (DUF421 family)